MRYRPDHKFRAHCQLTEAAAALAKQAGFAATPLRRFMALVKRSTGAFYVLYDNKDDLLRAIVEQELERTLQRFDAADMTGLFEIFAAYLHPGHVEDSSGGCVLPALAAEIGRADVATRRACEKGLLRLHDRLAYLLGDQDAAWAALSQAVGAVLIARTMATCIRREEVLTSALQRLPRSRLNAASPPTQNAPDTASPPLERELAEAAPPLQSTLAAASPAP